MLMMAWLARMTAASAAATKEPPAGPDRSSEVWPRNTRHGAAPCMPPIIVNRGVAPLCDRGGRLGLLQRLGQQATECLDRGHPGRQRGQTGQEMTHPVALGPQVAKALGMGRNQQRHAGDSQAVSLQCGDL